LIKSSNTSSALTITAVTLGAEHKLFNQLILKIESVGVAIAELSALADAHRPARMAKLAPLLQLNCRADENIVLFLESRLHAPKGLSNKQQEDLACIAQALARSVFEQGFGSPALGEALARIETFLFGADAGDSKSDSTPDEVEMFQEGEHSASYTDEYTSDYAAWRQAREARRKKSAKEIQAEQEHLDAESALRTVYRKLASALHPDRETDPQERIRKTNLMTQVNFANDKKDLLALLKLQLQIEQIQPDLIARMADEKIRSFNRMLKVQLKALTDEQASTSMQLQQEFNLMAGKITAKSLDSALKFDVLVLTNQLNLREDELISIQTNRTLKSWLKKESASMDEAMAFDDFEAMLRR
jgi:hypothetical protein